MAQRADKSRPEDRLEDIFGSGEHIPLPSATEGASGNKGASDDESDNSDDDSDDDSEGSEGKDAKEPPYVTPDQLDKLKSEIQSQNTSLMTDLFSRLRKSDDPKPEPKPEPNTGELSQINKAIGLAIKNEKPELVGQLVDKKVQILLDQKRGDIVEDVMGRVGSSNAADQFTQRLMGTYDGEPNEEIVSGALSEKETLGQMLSQFMTPEQIESFKKNPISDRLAYVVAAGLNPSAVAKQHVTREEARRKLRDEEIQRLSSLVSGSGGDDQKRGKDEITADEIEIAGSLGIDLTDKTQRERYLGERRTTKLELLGGQLMGDE